MGRYARERELIAEHLTAHGVDNLLMVSGDAHMVAIDDGSHANYSSTPGPAFPLIHVAALDRPGSEKGGPYTHGPIAAAGISPVLTSARQRPSSRSNSRPWIGAATR